MDVRFILKVTERNDGITNETEYVINDTLDSVRKEVGRRMPASEARILQDFMGKYSAKQLNWFIESNGSVTLNQLLAATYTSLEMRDILEEAHRERLADEDAEKALIRMLENKVESLLKPVMGMPESSDTRWKKPAAAALKLDYTAFDNRVMLAWLVDETLPIAVDKIANSFAREIYGICDETDKKDLNEALARCNRNADDMVRDLLNLMADGPRVDYREVSLEKFEIKRGWFNLSM